MTEKSPKTLIDVLKHLYTLADDFPYSQLALCLDPKNLFDLIRVFGGQRLYIPTAKEFTQLLQFCVIEESGGYNEAMAINKEVLNGFSETRYNRFADRVYHRTPETGEPLFGNSEEVGQDGSGAGRKRRSRRKKHQGG